MQADKYNAINEFLKQYTPLTTWLYFNAISYEDGQVSVNTIESDRFLQEFIDGSKDVEMLFSIAMIKQYDTNTSNLNIEAINEVNNFIDFIEEMCYNKVYPEITNCTVYDIQCLDSVPTLSVDIEQNLCKYQFNCKMSYIERK